MSRQSLRAWSGGTGKHGGPQTGTVNVRDAIDLGPPRAVVKPPGPTPAVLLITSSNVAPAVCLLRGEWARRFRSVAGALAWCDREGWPVENRAEVSP